MPNQKQTEEKTQQKEAATRRRRGMTPEEAEERGLDPSAYGKPEEG